MRDAHIALAWALIVTNGLVGCWALAAHVVPGLRHRAVWAAVIVAELVVVAQVVVGVMLLNSTDVEPAEFHELYGLGSLWLMGLGIRALTL